MVEESEQFFPIWEGPVPALCFSAGQGGSVPEEEERTVLKDEFERLRDAGCTPRSTFFATGEPDGPFFGDDEVSELRASARTPKIMQKKKRGGYAAR